MTPSAQGSAGSPEWRTHIISDDEGIAALLERSKRIAVLGIKTADAASQPAYYVPAYAQKAGYKIIPVPVYYPDATEILGERVYRAVSDVPEPVDIVNVFRRPADIAEHLGDILSAQPAAVWFQLGIRSDAAAEQLAKAGIDVVQDRCLLVELRKTGR